MKDIVIRLTHDEVVNALKLWAKNNPALDVYDDAGLFDNASCLDYDCDNDEWIWLLDGNMEDNSECCSCEKDDENIEVDEEIVERMEKELAGEKFVTICDCCDKCEFEDIVKHNKNRKSCKK
jgi:hypothetical protein